MVKNRTEVYQALADEISDPNVLGQLHGVQENALLVGAAMESIDKALPGKRGWLDMIRALLPRLREEMTALSGKVDKQLLPADEAKIRIDQMRQVVALVEGIYSETQRDIDKLLARREGLKSAEDIAAQQFDAIQARWERDKRLALEDDEFMGRNQDPLQAMSGASALEQAKGNGEQLVRTPEGPHEPVIDSPALKPRKRRPAKKGAKKRG